MQIFLLIKQYEIEEQFTLEVGERVVLTDAVLIKRIDHERCVIVGTVEAKTDQVDLDYEFNRFFFKIKNQRSVLAAQKSYS